MYLKKLAAGAAMAGALGFSALGIGNGIAQAKPHPGPPIPPIPGIPLVCPGGPGVNCNGPGTPLPPGWGGVTPPPGHWGDPAYYGLPTTWAPDWVPRAQNVVWNNDLAQWGIWWLDQFIPLPPPPQ